MGFGGAGGYGSMHAKPPEPLWKGKSTGSLPAHLASAGAKRLSCEARRHVDRERGRAEHMGIEDVASDQFGC